MMWVPNFYPYEWYNLRCFKPCAKRQGCETSHQLMLASLYIVCWLFLGIGTFVGTYRRTLKLFSKYVWKFPRALIFSSSFIGQLDISEFSWMLGKPPLCLEKEGDLSEIQKVDCLRIEFLAMIQINRILFRFFEPMRMSPKQFLKKLFLKKLN